MPPKYKATATIILNYKGYDPVSGLALPAPLMPGYMATQISILSSQKIALDVVEQLHLDKQPDMVESYNKNKDDLSLPINYTIANKLLKNLWVDPAKDSGILDITFKGKDPDFSAKIVNAFVDSYIQESTRLDSEPSRNASDYLANKMEQIKKDYDNAQKKLSETQQKLGITSIEAMYDAETAKLQGLLAQTGAAKAQEFEAESRKFNAIRNGESSSDVMLNPVLKDLKVAISNNEARLAQLSNLYDQNHPRYLAEKSQLDELKADYAREVQKAKATVANTSNIYSSRSGSLNSEIAQQKNKILNMNFARNQLLSLERDVQIARESLVAAAQRRAVSDLMGSSNQSAINILNRAIPIKEPYLPNLKLFLAGAVFIGLFLGVVIAFYLEWNDQKVRTINDIELIFEIPTLAVIDTSKQLTKSRSNFLLPHRP